MFVTTEKEAVARLPIADVPFRSGWSSNHITDEAMPVISITATNPTLAGFEKNLERSPKPQPIRINKIQGSN